jgi:hypothetical protein
MTIRKVFAKSGRRRKKKAVLEKLKPVAAIGNPPTQNNQRNGREQRPPKWKNEVRE